MSKVYLPDVNALHTKLARQSGNCERSKVSERVSESRSVVSDSL